MSKLPGRVVSVLPVLGHPRDSKRIAMLQEAGFQVQAMAFERDYHTGRMPPCPVVSLGHIEHGRYLARVFKILRALPALRRGIRTSDLAYASGPDMALAAWVAGLGLGRPVVLEVGDIRRAQVAPGIRGGLTRVLDRFVANASSLVVITAAGFVDGYYRKRLGCRTPSLVLENKLDERAMVGLGPVSPSAPDAGRAVLRVGYFGVLRCPWSWEMLASFARKHPHTVKVVIAGFPMDPPDLPERASVIPNVEYRGTYRSPQDLPGLYGSVDVVWACYPGPEHQDPDWRWAQSICRSNRFYESCFFRRPLITVAGSGDAAEIEKYGIGLLISDQSEPAVVKALESITPDDLARWRQHLETLPRSVHMYTTEVADLREALLGLIGSRRQAVSP